MKIIHICPKYYPNVGGVEKIVQNICENLQRMGHDINVVTTDPTGKLNDFEVINGVAIKRLRSIAPSASYFFAPQIYYHLKKISADIFHLHSYHAFPSLFGAFAKKKIDP
jgi:glycosyltransferase involved in cell wall biosynthesis